MVMALPDFQFKTAYRVKSATKTTGRKLRIWETPFQEMTCSDYLLDITTISIEFLCYLTGVSLTASF